jgi:phosphoribosylformylglycinamidine synthase
MARVRVVIIRAAGTNCDLEAEHAWRLAGAEVDRVHVGRLSETPAALDNYQIVTLPGGFSYGDDIAAGRIFAAQIKRHLLDALQRFVDTGKLVLGICNGFQVLVQAGLLPWRLAGGGERRCTVTFNAPPGFQDRWIALRASDSPCVLLEPGRVYEMPIAHGEGRVAFTSEADFVAVRQARLDALRYVPRPGVEDATSREHFNPNGSTGDIGGLCDATGRVLGLMPHPERFVAWTQHPCWTALPARPEGDGLALFRRGVGHFG